MANKKARHERRPFGHPVPFPVPTTERSTHEELFLSVDLMTMPKIGLGQGSLTREYSIACCMVLKLKVVLTWLFTKPIVVNMERAVGYIRVSTVEQASNNMSLDNQRDAIHRYCEENGLSLVNMFEDAGESAKTADRPGLQEAISFSSENQIGTFIIWKVDRLTRNNLDYATLALHLKSAGVQLKSVTENIDDTPAGRFTGQMLSAMAEYDNGVKAERVVKGMSKRKAMGGWPHHAPLGYINSRAVDGTPSLSLTKDAIKLRRWFREYTAKELSIGSMRKLADEMGLITKKGNPISIQQVRNMLTNIVYAGQVGYDAEGRLIKGLHEPIISLSEFEEIQNQLHGRNRPYDTTDDELWPLRGSFVRCSECNTPLTSSTPKGRGGKRFMSYSCPNCRASIVGHKVSIPREQLHNEFIELLASVKPTGAHLSVRGDHFKKVFRLRMKDVTDEVKMLRSEIETLRHRRRKVLENFIEGRLTVGEKTIMTDDIMTRIARNTRRIQSIEMTDGNLDSIVNFAMKIISNLDSTWVEACDTVQRKRRMQASIFPEGLVYDFGSGFRTPKSSILYEVVGTDSTHLVKPGTPGRN